MEEYKQFCSDKRDWGMCKAKIYVLALQHCPSNLCELLNTLSKWEATTDADTIDLIGLIRDVTYNQVKQKQTKFKYLELCIELFIFHQGKGISNKEY